MRDEADNEWRKEWEEEKSRAGTKACYTQSSSAGHEGGFQIFFRVEGGRSGVGQWTEGLLSGVHHGPRELILKQSSLVRKRRKVGLTYGSMLVLGKGGDKSVVRSSVRKVGGGTASISLQKIGGDGEHFDGLIDKTFYGSAIVEQHMKSSVQNTLSPPSSWLLLRRLSSGGCRRFSTEPLLRKKEVTGLRRTSDHSCRGMCRK